MKVFFIADTHFSDENIRRYEKRPFETSIAMNVEMVKKWNSVVGEKDIVYILGDFGTVENGICWAVCLNGKKILIKGNHDTESNENYRSAGFFEVYDHPILFDNFWILSHEPIYVNENMPYANIFGHVHKNPIYKDYSRQHFCVSAERIDYKPISFAEIKAKVSGEK